MTFDDADTSPLISSFTGRTLNETTFAFLAPAMFDEGLSEAPLALTSSLLPENNLMTLVNMYTVIGIM